LAKSTNKANLMKNDKGREAQESEGERHRRRDGVQETEGKLLDKIGRGKETEGQREDR
jgi:hypothetical protein